jgi:tetratricopeptide (TPR) repeat protein
VRALLFVGFSCLAGLLSAQEMPRLQAIIAAKSIMVQAEKAFRAGDRTNGLALATEAVAKDPTYAPAWMLRGQLRSAIAQHREAAGDFAKVIELQPKNADAYWHRGIARLRLGRVSRSLEDFDQVMVLAPARVKELWPRGLALCLEGQWAAARKQFEACLPGSTNDVELAAWHFLAAAKLDGPAKARTGLLPVAGDTRVPMPEIQALLAGRGEAATVLAAADAGEVVAEERALRRFYARLYLGLLADADGDPLRAAEWLAEAAPGAEHFGLIGDVARLYAAKARLTGAPQPSTAPTEPAPRPPG